MDPAPRHHDPHGVEHTHAVPNPAPRVQLERGVLGAGRARAGDELDGHRRLE